MQTVIAAPSLTRSVSASFLLRIFSAGLEFLISFGLARLLGAADFGAYDYADSLLTILITFSLLGFDRFLVRKLAAHQVKEEWGQMRGLWRDAVRIVFILACVLALALIGISSLRIPVISSFFPSSELARLTLWIAMLMLPIWAMIRVSQAAMFGVNAVLLGQLPDFFVRPFLFVVFILSAAILTAGNLSAPLAAGLHVTAGLIAFGLTQVLLNRTLPRPMVQAAIVNNRHDWMAATLPLLLISSMTLISLRGGSLVLGSLTDLQTVGFHGVAVRVAALIPLILTSIGVVLAPVISNLYVQGEKARLQAVFSRSIRISLSVAVPVAFMLIVFGRPLLRLFGSEFENAYPALLILCVGQLINAGTGPVHWMLMMTGHEWDSAVVMTVSVILSLLLMVILVPSFGLSGAALATSFNLIVQNLIISWLVWRRLHILPLPFLRRSSNEQT